MKKQLKNVSPFRAGVVLGILYALLGLIIMPLFMLAAIFGNKAGAPGNAPAAGNLFMVGGLFFAMFIPIFYGVMGFIGGIISAFIYNLVAKWTGGLEFEVQDSEVQGS